MADLVLHARDVEHLLGDACQAFGVLLHHVAQPLLRGVAEVFAEQCVGLHDGGQWVADFMRHGGRHAPHGGELFGAQPCLQFAQVMQKHHALRLRAGLARTLLCGREPGAHAQTGRALPRVQKADIGALRLPAGEGGVRHAPQRFPCRLGAEQEGRL